MAVARQIVTNPANRQQRYILYTNGYLQAIGGAVQPTPGDTTSTWNINNGPPLFQGIEPARAVQIIDWSVPKGYTLDCYGNVFPFGGAAAVAGAVAPATGGPEYLFGTNGGFSNPAFGYVQDFAMDPAGGGTGYMLLMNGDVIAIGTGVTAVAHGPVIGGALARAMVMDWTSKRYWILDTLGRISGYNGGSSPLVTAPPVLGAFSYTYPSSIYGADTDWNTGEFALYDLSASPKGWYMDSYGRVWRIGSAQDAYGFERSDSPAVRQWSGFAIIDDGTGANPLRLVQMTVQGRQNEFVVSTAPTTLVSEPTGTFSAQNRPWVGWQYLDREGDAQTAYEVRIATSAAYLAGTTNEVQSVATTGAPTGGTFRLAFRRSANAPDSVTGTIAFNASAATVQAALEALPNIGSGGVVCAGGPLGTGAVSVTFQNQMAGWDWPVLTLYNNSLTGGTSPNVTRSTTTGGVGANPASIANVFSQLGTGVTNRVRSTAVLANSTTFRAFVRTTDSSGLVSPWDYSQFATAFTALNIPTVTPTVLGGLAGINLAVAAATGAGLPGTARFGVQFSDDGGTTWYNVRNGDALVPDGTGKASVVDSEAPFGVARSYRAATYTYDSAADLWQQADWSGTVTATLTPTSIWAFTNPFSTANQLVASIREFTTEAEVVSQMFQPVTRTDPVVLSDGAPKYPSVTIQLNALDAATVRKIDALANAGLTLLLRNPFGEVFYVRLMDKYTRDYLRAGPLPSESTPLRNAKVHTIQAQAVRRPQAGPTTGPLAEVT